MFEAGDAGQARRLSARRNQDDARADHSAITVKPHPVRIFDFRTALDDGNPGFFEIGAIDPRQTRNLFFLCRDERSPIEGGLRDAPAEPRRVLEFVFEAARIDHQLFRHAAAYDTGPADPELFRDQDLGAVTGSHPRSANATGTRSDDEEIDVEFGHARLSPP